MIVRLSFLFLLWLTCHAFATSSPTQAITHPGLLSAIKNPEYLLDHWIELPTALKPNENTVHHLTLREAILLALRYNPNIQNAELDRIIQRYQLRIAHREFEWQYALAGTAMIQRSRYSDAGSTSIPSFLASPEVHYRNTLGSQVSLSLDNNTAVDGNYTPLLNLGISQPLLRGFGKAANETALLNAIDQEYLNKQLLRQTIADQITRITIAYHALILSGNTLKNQRLQLEEAQRSFTINEKKIHAGQLEPSANIQQAYQVESISLILEQAEHDFKTTGQILLETIGLDPHMRIAVPSDISLHALPVPDVQTSIAQGLRHNSQYQALKLQLRADQRAYTAAKNQQLWQLDASANLQAGTVTNVDSNVSGLQGIYRGRNVNESAGVTLTIPFNDVQRKQLLITAKIALEKDRLNLIAAKNTLTTSIKNTIFGIQSQAKRYALAKRQVALATESYALEKKKQLAGIATTLDVTNTQNQLILAQNSLISAKIAYLDQLSVLQQLLGVTLEHWNIQVRYAA